jgi:hypothetical protein
MCLEYRRQNLEFPEDFTVSDVMRQLKLSSAMPICQAIPNGLLNCRQIFIELQVELKMSGTYILKHCIFSTDRVSCHSYMDYADLSSDL